MRKKVVILGGTGRLGHMLGVLGSEYYEIFSFSNMTENSTKFDNVTQITGLGRFPSQRAEVELKRVKPDMIVNALGYINAIYSQRRLINSNCECSSWALALSEQHDAWCINISSDAVYGGQISNASEHNKLAAFNAYSASKILGEISGEKAINLRTSFIGPTPNMKNCNTIGLFNHVLNASEELWGYQNVIWSGVTSYQLAKSIIRIIHNPIAGTFNIGGEHISKYKLTREIAEVFGSGKNVKIIDAKVAADFSLNSSKFNDMYGGRAPSHKKMLLDLKHFMEINNSIYGRG